MIARPSGRAVEGKNDRTPRTSQRCGPGEIYAACRSRSESNGYRQHCGRVAAQYRLAAPSGLVGRSILSIKCMPLWAGKVCYVRPRGGGW
nr:MAG TPA: hypothetical protein [Caudoviricetes sp.]